MEELKVQFVSTRGFGRDSSNQDEVNELRAEVREMRAFMEEQRAELQRLKKARLD